MNTSNGGRFVDTKTHEAPRLPRTFKPDYGIEHPAARRVRAGYWLVKALAIFSAVVIVLFWRLP